MVAGVFTLVWIVVVFGLVASVVGWSGAWRDERRRLNWFLPLVGVFGVLMVYLVVKIVYEEVIPCVSIDEKYCDFSSTQYRNLFGWEF